MTCDKCDVPGSTKTYENQVSMPIKGRVRNIDHCIHKIVAALNAGNVETVACCCGHGKHDGNIALADGRVLIIKPPGSVRFVKEPSGSAEGSSDAE